MIELRFDGYYRGPETFYGSYPFLKLFEDGRWIFSDSLDPDYDFLGRMAALGVEEQSQLEDKGRVKEEENEFFWGRYQRLQNVPALTFAGEEMNTLADVLQSITPDSPSGYRTQVEVVGPGQLRPTTDTGVMTFVPDA